MIERTGSPESRPGPLDTSQTSARMASRYKIWQNWDSAAPNQSPFSSAPGAAKPGFWSHLPESPKHAEANVPSPLIFAELLPKKWDIPIFWVGHVVLEN